MKLFTFLSNKLSVFSALIAAIALTSCGSYQYVGQTNDGIYETSDTYDQQTVIIEDESNKNDYYTNYFKEKALEAEAYDNNTDDIFTDIDSYEGTYTDSTEVVQRAGWGDTNNKVVINVYNDVYANQVARFGWNNWGWNSWGMTPWGWNNWRWNRPWGWNAGFYNPFWYGGYYGYGYNPYFYGYGYSPYYNGYAYNGIYTRRGISYNAGRRGTLLRNSSLLSGRSNATRSNRSNSTVRPRTTTRSNSSTRPRSNTTRPRSNTTRPRSNTTRPRSNTTRPRSNTTRPRSNTTRPRSNTTRPRSSSSSTRSFGGSRSSSSSRSSSGRRGG